MSADNAVAPKRKLKPARKQVASDEVDKSQGYQAGREYNIWYNKWAGGDREDALASKVHSQTRCIISRDAGYTRADATGNKYCCLFFARGCCPYGYECQYLHRLPLPSHQLPDNSRDCFGREKHADYRDDMGGVGSFNRQNRTLYIGKIQESPDKKQMTETLLRHFGEWGKIVKHNILFGRGVAFVTYETDHQASFAKEAMANQSMDGDEILNVRWATEDPNPGEKIAEEKRIEEIGQKAIAGMLDEDLVEATQAVRALEDGDVEDFYHIEASKPEEDEEEEEENRPAKKGKSEGGFFNADALDNIKFYAEMVKKQAEEEREKARKVPTKQVGMSLLGGYGSGDESD
ncbi:pre-mRNA-splicing factor CWC2 [Cryptococcus gattii E566]|uniref:Nuclear mRNA splicing, via spliceosome-related protein, putative n=4 Tax=Cryptococcus gattii species complex TaxID=1884637 RepID=E6RBF1_CRYGW|nr:Nuclear mRNA splicing, via spliceosome-related protein, putative [Cryptococcus gattii WM276]KIR47585.1 pre-mRNA-splicing factor CWC2 [Cryptococcus bacillisporus CA1280]KIR62359.1 pre-mRNA-splicing factor CWC2 [Cryptococcus bacillisporus CA1873]KIR81185.1 pre-mRNA-splicing factor CWC2 [Cryptococcus gattii EJB2]KIY34821.1 pre-mRNA-splicing factor CWC2 [Cryptococcus gattii E566]KJE01362.1 pre-mRNA-splicing factor CWC2 [Cryptococcus gattii NT-10]|eukprot:KIR62359.1 pre-mRNA-splicing factor CWC2 [Cryptococcus gattii CA1873]